MTATPFGLPVDPDVKMIHASSSGCGSRQRPCARRYWDQGDFKMPADHCADSCFRPHSLHAFNRVVYIDRDICSAAGHDAKNGNVKIRRSGLRPDADPVAGPDAQAPKALGEGFHPRTKHSIRQTVGSVVNRREFGIGCDCFPNGVYQGAGPGSLTSWENRGIR